MQLFWSYLGKIRPKTSHTTTQEPLGTAATLPGLETHG